MVDLTRELAEGSFAGTRIGVLGAGPLSPTPMTPDSPASTSPPRDPAAGCPCHGLTGPGSVSKLRAGGCTRNSAVRRLLSKARVDSRRRRPAHRWREFVDMDPERAPRTRPAQALVDAALASMPTFGGRRAVRIRSPIGRPIPRLCGHHRIPYRNDQEFGTRTKRSGVLVRAPQKSGVRRNHYCSLIVSGWWAVRGETPNRASLPARLELRLRASPEVFLTPRGDGARVTDAQDLHAPIRGVCNPALPTRR